MKFENIVHLKVPDQLLADIDAVVSYQGDTRSAFIRRAVAEKTLKLRRELPELFAITSDRI